MDLIVVLFVLQVVLLTTTHVYPPVDQSGQERQCVGCAFAIV